MDYLQQLNAIDITYDGKASPQFELSGWTIAIEKSRHYKSAVFYYGDRTVAGQPKNRWLKAHPASKSDVEKKGWLFRVSSDEIPLRELLTKLKSITQKHLDKRENMEEVDREKTEQLDTRNAVNEPLDLTPPLAAKSAHQNDLAYEWAGDIKTVREEFARLVLDCFTCCHFATCRSECPLLDEDPPQPGFIGRRYRGLVIVGANPGISNTLTFRKLDSQQFELLQRYVNTKDMVNFDAFCDYLAQAMAKWRKTHLCGQFARKYLNYDIEEVAFINLLKCRTTETSSDPYKTAGENVTERCIQNYTIKQLELLRPRFIAGQWKTIPGLLKHNGYDLDYVDIAVFNGRRNLSLDAQYADLLPLFERFKQDGIATDKYSHDPKKS